MTLQQPCAKDAKETQADMVIHRLQFNDALSLHAKASSTIAEFQRGFFEEELQAANQELPPG